MMFAFVALHAVCQTGLDRVRKILEDAPVQEKVYLHLDNNSYYKGDTIWYKSYVVRADNLDYTDMSKLVYVELVSPDGLVVERQQLIASADGLGYGNFALKDSLYSGYYELRAYTRWMLNFCVTEHPNTRVDREQFYNRQMARDFFRQYGTIYSRVVPVYERPETPGGYEQKHLTGRPKTRLDKEKKENLTVNFYSEGGCLIVGTRCNVAFEALNEEGKQVDVSGRLDLGGKTLDVKTMHQGRGVFTVDVPEDGALKATFNYEGKEYAFNLPKTSKAGCSLHVDAVGDKLTAEVSLRGLDDGREYALAVLCRGVLKHFQTFRGSQTIEIDKKKIPTGVCDMLVIDENGNPLADRLFFVNHHDYDMQPVTVEAGLAKSRSSQHLTAVHLHIIVADVHRQIVKGICLPHHALHHGQGNPGENPGHEAMARQLLLLHLVDHIGLVSLVNELFDFPGQLQFSLLGRSFNIQLPILVRMKRQPVQSLLRLLLQSLHEGFIDDLIRHEELALADFLQAFPGPGAAHHLEGGAVILHLFPEFSPINLLNLLHPGCW